MLGNGRFGKAIHSRSFSGFYDINYYDILDYLLI
jgi:hypothetical protein